MSCTIFS